jgi:multidrug resistance efflux pump
VAERYPQQAAERLRNAQRGGAEIALAQAGAELNAANEALARVQAAFDAHRTAAPDAPAGGQGPIDALELQRGAAFAQRHAERTRVLWQHVLEAQAQVAQRTAALSSAQHALAHARADERVMERDRERFENAQRRAREQAEQLEVEERIDRSRNDRG